MLRFSLSSVALLLAGMILPGGFGLQGARAAEPRTAAIREIFKPFQTDQASLAPDGKHLAFEKRENEQLFLAIVDLEAKRMIELPLTNDLAKPLSGMKEKVPMRITYLKWPTSDRVVACVQDEILVAVDADGRNFKRLLDGDEMRQKVRNLNRPDLSARNLPTDPSTGRILETESGMPVLYGPDGKPMDRGLRVPPVAPIAPIAADADPNQPPPPPDVGADRLAQAADLTTVDLFNSSGSAGPVVDLRPHVLDLVPDEPENLLVEIRGRLGPTDDVELSEAENLHSTVLKVNIRSGKTSGQVDEFFTTRIVCDKQGHVRGMLRQAGSERVLQLAPKVGARFLAYDKALAGTSVRALEVTPETLLGSRSMSLGFGYNPDIFYYASNVNQDTYAIRSVDLVKKQDTGFVLEHPSLDFVNASDFLPEEVLVFDRYRRSLVGARFVSSKRETFWLDRELALLQRSMEEASKGLEVEILEWDEKRTKFLVRLSEQSDPGAFYLYDATARRISEVVRRAPWILPAATNPAKAFAFTTAAGIKLTGYFTTPRNVRVEPLPLLVYCHDGPWSRDLPGYDRGAQALATMGFAVLQVNYRGSAGFGRAHLTALRDQGEKVALEDVVAALDWVQGHEPVSKKRVAILGNGYGGYLALRAMQTSPERFRCAVSINAPTDLPRWLEEGGTAYSFTNGVREAFFKKSGASLKAASPALNGQAITGPVLIIQATNDQLVPDHHAREMRRVLAGGPVKPEYFELAGEGHARWLPGSYVKVFDKLEEFFTANIYNYQVEVGETSVVK